MPFRTLNNTPGNPGTLGSVRSGILRIVFPAIVVDNASQIRILVCRTLVCHQYLLGGLLVLYCFGTFLQ